MSDNTRTNAVDLGDITSLAGPEFPNASLDGDGDSIDYFRFTLTEAKKVGLGLRRQDANADLFLEDADGNVLYSSTETGTANEWLEVTLLAGTYYVRVEAQEAGENNFKLRYGVTAADPDALAALEQQQQVATDAPPAFGEASYAFALAENADGSTNRVSLGTVSATDPEDATVSYSIEGGNTAGLFEIDAATGALSYTGAGEDYESGATSYALTVRASDSSLHTDVTVTVGVTDAAEAPGFARAGYTFDLAENADGSTNRVSLGTVSATDPENATVSYSIEGGNAAGLFEIDAATGALSYTGAGEDYESGATSYALTLRASDSSLHTDVTVTVGVTDAAEAPEFARVDYAFDLAENADGSTNRVSLGTVSATDPEDAAVTYSIEGGNAAGLFEIDAATGALSYTGAGADYESGATSYELTLRASDSSLHSDTTVTVNITDVVEQAIIAPPADPDDTRDGATDLGDITSLAGPEFPNASLDGDGDSIDYFRFTLTEAKQVELGLRRQDANADLFLEDADGNVLYSSTETGTTNEWISETLLAGTYYVRVEAQEAGENNFKLRYGVTAPDPDALAALEQQQQVATDAPPAFGTASYAFALAENADGSTNRVSLGTVSATDPENATVSYSIEGGNAAGLFEIDAATGALFYTGSGEDYESATTSHALTVRATDGTRTADTAVTVNVTDVVEAPGFGQASYAFDLAENADGSSSRVSLGTVSATDPENATVSYSIEGGNEAELFEIDAATGELFYTGSGEDYESATTSHALTVRATDGTRTADTAVTVNVTDVVEAPGFGQASYAFDLAENADGSSSRVSLGTVSATDPEGETVTYSIAGGNEAELFEIDAATGELFYTGSGEDYESDTTSHALTVRATDGTLTADAAVTVTVTDVTEVAPVADADGVRAGASEMGQGSASVTGTVDGIGDTVDYHQFTLTETKQVSVDLFGMAGANWELYRDADLYLEDAEGNVLARSTAEGRGAEILQDMLLSAGTYYVRVEAKEAGDNSYMLTNRLADPPQEDPPRVDVSDAEAHETEDETVRFRVTLDRAALNPVTVRYETVDGTAGEDYEASSGELTFAAGELEKWVEVTLVDDTVEDSGETFGLRLSRVTGAVLGDTEGVGTILNTEPPVSVSEPAGTDFAADRSTAGSVVVGESVTGTIEHIFDCDWFAVELEAGTIYRIDLEGSPTGQGTLSDPRLHGIYGSNGNRIDRTGNDDDGKGLNSRVLFMPDADGTYYVVANSYLARGTYRLSVAETNIKDDYPAAVDTTGAVAVGGSATGDIQCPDDRDWFAVELEAGTTYRIDLEGRRTNQGTLYDPYLRGVHDSDGNLIAGTTNDDGGNILLNSRVYFTPEADGTYYVAAGGGGRGTYRVSVADTTKPDDYTAAVDTTGALVVGGSATGEIETVRDRDWFAVTLEAGTSYQIDLEGSQTSRGTLYDPYLYGIHDSDGNLIAGTTSDDGGGISNNSRVFFTPEADGTYYVAVGAYKTDAGTYRLSVAEGALQDDYAADTSTTGAVEVGGSVTGDLETGRDSDWFAVTLEAGTSYRIDLEGSSTGRGTLSDTSLRWIHDSDGNRIDGTWNDDGGEGSNSRVHFTPEADGTYYVVASSYWGVSWGSLGTYELSVEEVI